MEKDSHYYVIYFLCLAAGFDLDTSYTVAYSSQYVDDSIDGHKKTLFEPPNGDLYTLEPIRTSHNGFESLGTDVQEKIYYPFHFLPGLKGDSFDQKMVTKTGTEGELFKVLIQEALNSKNPYRTGITLHVLADTYSHTNFSGLWAWDNAIRHVNYIPARKGWILNLVNKCKWLTFRKYLETAPAIGHSHAYCFPDFPYMNWKYGDYDGKMHSVSNSFKFREGFLDLYEQLILPYAESQKLKPRLSQDKILQILWNGIRTTGNLKKRCKYWRKVIINFANEFKLKISNRHLKYGKTDWEDDMIENLKIFGIFSSSKSKLKVPRAEFEESHYYNFHSAAKDHRLFVLEKINEYFEKCPKDVPGNKIGQELGAISREYINEVKAKQILQT
ncbi:MAG TPA: DUF6765 family protein [Candidatus Kapabacteria bacterium]|nr:DUF6765 family protein [Candidatus Kapabacteria bacterium]